MKIGTIIKSARIRSGMTLSELAEAIDSSSSTLSALENGQFKNPPTPEELVRISEALRDVRMLSEYCDRCAIRKRVIPRKFPPMNRVQQGAVISTVKVIEKLSLGADKLHQMLVRMANPRFKDDPEARQYRNDAILRVLDIKRGTEVLLDQLQEDGIVTAEELQILIELQQREVEAKGYHDPGEGTHDRC